MKKLLSILGVCGLVGMSANLTACDKPNNNENGENNKPEPELPPKNSNWKLIEYGHGEINDVLKTYIGLKLIGKTWFVNTWKGKELKSDTWEIFGYKDIYRWDGISEPETPDVDKNTGKITDWKG
ncbi:Spiroplasmavirus-related protein [Spiroplasma melliferum]|uniref:Spiroplasmavirus-related protein n=1 Tax=Spiroplasma melliferum TaxID=2134 RepID=A0ABX5U903_SPIME|nr:lipoprotein [Spiroplasma melliferum]QCO23818.1 Spiroplasmavirus-related protein [Spiroplasma melliferum]